MGFNGFATVFFGRERRARACAGGDTEDDGAAECGGHGPAAVQRPRRGLHHLSPSGQARRCALSRDGGDCVCGDEQASNGRGAAA